MSNARYQFLGRPSEDSDHESAINDALLMRGDSDDTNPPTCSGDVDLVVLLRFGPGACAVASFILFVASRHEDFIAAAVFAMLLFVFNLCFVVSPTCKAVASFLPYKITIEPRNPRGQISLGHPSTGLKNGSKFPFFSICMGLLLTLAYFLAMIIPQNTMHYWYRRHMQAAWTAGVVVGYIACVLQILVILAQIFLRNSVAGVKIYIRKRKSSQESSFLPIMTTADASKKDGQKKDGAKEPAPPAGDNTV